MLCAMRSNSKVGVHLDILILSMQTLPDLASIRRHNLQSLNYSSILQQQSTRQFLCPLLKNDKVARKLFEYEKYLQSGYNNIVGTLRFHMSRNQR